MPFVKVVKNKAYFKRYQVKFRRRREGKTDYYARKRLVTQDVSKYGTNSQTKKMYMVPKYRLVVRFTNSQVICQIVRSEIDHDEVVAAAYSSELKQDRYGLKVGLKNYAAAYCTGLLVARRVLKKLGMDQMYTGNEEVTGEVVSFVDEDEDTGRKRTYYTADMYHDEENDTWRRPFRCYLDVGIQATTTGARIFGALKGAADGGLDIPHNEKRFPGYDREGKSYDADVHRARIFGEHIGEYMSAMEEQDSEKFNAHFSQFIANDITADKLEDMYTQVHANIRADPSPAAKSSAAPDKKYKKPSKLTLEQRKSNVQQKKINRIKQLQGMH